MYLNGDGIARRATPAASGSTTPTSCSTSTPRDELGQVHAARRDEYAAAWDVVIDTGGRNVDHGAVQAGEQLHRRRPHRCVVLQAHQEPDVEPDHSVAASLAGFAAGTGASNATTNTTGGTAAR